MMYLGGFAMEKTRAKREKSPYGKQLQEMSEQRFQKVCDRSGFQWLYISQEKGNNFSKLLYEKQGKRPDFLVTIPNIGTVFFDVKAKLDRNFYEPYYGKNVPGFNHNTKDFLKLESLQDQTTINVWYAVFNYFEEKDGEINMPGDCYVTPLNVVSKFVLGRNISNPDVWKYFQVPKQCFKKCTGGKKMQLEVQCQDCSRLLCKDLQKKIEDKYE